MEFAVAVRRGTGEPGRERAFGEEKRTAGVLAVALMKICAGPAS
jgi:hypothetical protein